MKNKIGRILSTGVCLGIGIIPILSKVETVNSNFTEKSDHGTKLWGDFAIYDYRLIPPEMFQTPDGLHKYTTEFNKYLEHSGVDSDGDGDIDVIYMIDPNLSDYRFSYWNVLVERNFDGWWLFDIDNLVRVDTFGDREMIYLDPYLEFYLQDFFIWSYNERLNLDEINDTRELNNRDIQIDYELWIDDAVEIGVGWIAPGESPNDNFLLNNAVYITFDNDGFQNNELGDVDYDPIVNNSTYYAGFMSERMAYPSEKQSIDIYDNYSQDEIDEWFKDYFIPYFEEDMDINDNIAYTDSVYYDLAKQFHLNLNQEFINKYGFENLGNDRNVNEGSYYLDGRWRHIHMYETPDIRYTSRPIENEYMFNIYDESGELINNKLNFHDPWSYANENEDGIHEWWTWDESFETLYIKITPIDQVYYLNEEQTVEYHSSDIIDGYYREDGSLNEYYITINVWDAVGYEPDVPTPQNDSDGSSYWWISLIFLGVVLFIYVGLFGIWKFKKRKV